MFENSCVFGRTADISIAFYDIQDEIYEESLEQFLHQSIKRGKDALKPLFENGVLIDLEESIYDDIAYLNFTIRLCDQSFQDAELYVNAIMSRVDYGFGEPVLFICHASEDKPFVDKLVNELDQRALYAWYDKREIVVGDSIVARVSAGLSSARYLIAVLSPNAIRKPWVMRELNSSLMRQLADKNIAILPVLIEHCSIPALLADIKYADFTESFDHGLCDLVNSIRRFGNTL